MAERKRVERALRESEERFRAVVESAPYAITVEIESHFAYLNPAAEAFFCAPNVGGLIGCSVLDRLHPEDRPTVSERIRLLNEEGRSFPRVVQKIIGGDGKVIDAEVSATPFIYQGKRGALVFWRDVTEELEAQAERAGLLAQVQEQAERIAQIIDAVPEGLLLLDREGRVLMANPQAERDLAILARSTVGDRLSHLGDRALDELLVAPAMDRWHEARADEHIFEIVSTSITGDSGSRMWVLVIADVTRERAVREHLEQQERLAAVGQLAAGIAHDFNNILAIISLQSALLGREPDLPKRARERVTVVSDQTAHATRLVQQLLDFSRRSVLERQPLDFGRFVADQAELLARTLPENIQIACECQPGAHAVFADPTRIQQMIMNLAVNARDAMPNGGTLRLQLTSENGPSRRGLPFGPWLRLTVADSGSGIPADVIPHLFEPFYTTKPRGQGTGLGLAQVHGIVKQHGGEIEVRSAENEGTVFTIFLPEMERDSVRSEQTPAVALQMGAQELILIVEDNAVLREVMSDIVLMLGYQVITAADGQEALSLLSENGDTIAVVVSDLVMPVMGGEALLRAMRERQDSTPVVILSGHPLDAELAELKKLGLSGWLLKPAEPDELAHVIAKVLAT